MWVLILTLAFGTGGAAIHSIDGFNSHKNCHAAGQEWLENAATNKTGDTRSYICVVRHP